MAEITEEEYKNKYLYLLADFQNYKKQSEKRLASIEVNKHKDLVLKLLDVLDNCERSFECEGDTYRPLYNLLLKVLVDDGLKVIDIQVGDLFDETYMNAVLLANDDVFESRQILEITRKGYEYKGEIIRFADVVVNN